MNEVYIEKIEDIEKEDLGEVEPITTPFDPDKIDVDVQSVNLGALLNNLRYDEIDLSPEYQRSSGIWDSRKKSRLIESVLLGLPLPSFYFSQDPKTGRLSVIDGLQRISTFADFILKGEKGESSALRLVELEFLKQFEGKNYMELGRPEKRRIDELKIIMNILRKETPSKVKFVIFQRVNTGGSPLTAQEMRHALNQGAPAQIIKEMAELDSFKEATCNVVKTKRMEDRDFANRFLGFYLWKKGLLGEYKGNLDEFLNDALILIQDVPSLFLEEIKQAYDRALKCCYAIFREDCFRKRYEAGSYRKPISKSVFDALCVQVAILSTDDQSKLIDRGDQLRERWIGLCTDINFNSAITTGTGKKQNVETRFRMVESIIKETLNNDTSN